MAAVKVNMSGVVHVDTYLHVRNRPSMSGTIIEHLFEGDELTITQKDGAWCYATNTGGWSHSAYIELTDHGLSSSGGSSSGTGSITSIPKEEQERLTKEEEARRKAEEETRQANILLEEYNKTSLSDSEVVNDLIVNNLNGIYGVPYQFMRSVDPRLMNGSIESQIGRKYAERIITKMPLLCITPGKVEFMSNYSKAEQTGTLASLIAKGAGMDVETPVSNIIKNNGRYFTFAFNYAEYFEYVNPLCQNGSVFLGIQDVELDIGGVKGKAKSFDWSKALNKKLSTSIAMSQEFIGFYMDSTDSVSESFSNETTQSQLSSTVNGMSDLAREIGFLLGAGAGKQIQIMDQAKLTDTMATIEQISKDYLNNSSLLTNIGKGFATIAIGGKLLFPEIWADSQFSKSFDITIKLRTPDCDTVSWYTNIYVPLCHLIALAAGHQTDDYNGYYSPFLIRAFYKGLFNVDMGIITDMTITKGKEAAWNINGLPTEIDVNLTIKDLYNMLAISKGSDPGNFVNNNILMDYIANTCGININQMDIQRSLEIWMILRLNIIKNLPNTFMNRFEDAVNTYAMDLWNGFSNKFLI